MVSWKAIELPTPKPMLYLIYWFRFLTGYFYAWNMSEYISPLYQGSKSTVKIESSWGASLIFRFRYFRKKVLKMWISKFLSTLFIISCYQDWKHQPRYLSVVFEICNLYLLNNALYNSQKSKSASYYTWFQTLIYCPQFNQMWDYFFKAMVLLFLVFKANKHKREICWIDTVKI